MLSPSLLSLYRMYTSTAAERAAIKYKREAQILSLFGSSAARSRALLALLFVASTVRMAANREREREMQLMHAVVALFSFGRLSLSLVAVLYSCASTRIPCFRIERGFGPLSLSSTCSSIKIDSVAHKVVCRLIALTANTRC